MPFLYPFISFYYRLNIAFVGHDPLQTLLTNACYLTLAPYPTSKPFNHLNSFCLTFSFSLTAKTIKGTSSIPFNHFNSFYLTFFFLLPYRNEHQRYLIKPLQIFNRFCLSLSLSPLPSKTTTGTSAKHLKLFYVYFLS